MEGESVLSRFAHDIGERARHLETKADVDQLRRKLIATQVKDVKGVYPYVDTDFSAIEFRAPGVMESYQVDPRYLMEVLDNVKIDSKVAGEQPTYEEFVETVQPPKGKELYTFFAHEQTHEKIGLLGQDQRHLIKAIRNYTPSHAEANMQIGRLIAAMTWPEEVDEVVEDIASGVGEEEEMDPECIDRSYVTTMDQKKELEVSDEPKQWDESVMREDPDIKDYKIQAGIGGRFPSSKVVTQILTKSDKHPSILGKNQVGMPITTPKEEYYTIVDCYPKSLVEALVATDQAQELYYAMTDKPTDGRTLIKTLIKGPQASGVTIHKRYGRKYAEGELSDDVVTKMVEFHA